MPTSLPLYSKGAETAVTRSPVWGETPRQAEMVWVCWSWLMSPVPGTEPEMVRPLEE